MNQIGSSNSIALDLDDESILGWVSWLAIWIEIYPIFLVSQSGNTRGRRACAIKPQKELPMTSTPKTI